MFPAEGGQGDPLASCFSPHTVSKCSFRYLVQHILCFCAFLLVISLFKMAPCTVRKVPTTVPKQKTTVMCLTEQTRVR